MLAHKSVYCLCILFYFLLSCFLMGGLSYHQDNISETRIINVGKELEKEILPLQFGQRLYQLLGLKDSVWYEIKISYPASIPASFSIQLAEGDSTLRLENNRRLLNTEKLIFKANSSGTGSGNHKQYVLVTAQSAGVVAKPGVLERKTVLFNIVCDELSLGIPYNAWCVGMVAILCLVLAFSIPYFLPIDILINRLSELTSLAASKSS